MEKERNFNEQTTQNPSVIDGRKEYYRTWRKNNKDKIKKHNETFWKKQAEKMNNQKQ